MKKPNIHKGQLKFLNIIYHLSNVLKRNPTKAEVNAFNELYYGCTARNVEMFSSLIHRKLVADDGRSLALTPAGASMLMENGAGVALDPRRD